MANVNPTISIITLNVNGLKYLIKRQRLPDWIEKNKIQLYPVYRRCFKFKDTNRLKVLKEGKRYIIQTVTIRKWKWLYR